MDNLHLFELINAPPGLSPLRLWLITTLAERVIYLVPIAMGIAWVRGDPAARRELVQMLLSAIIALGIAQIVTMVWPQPRPLALHLGTQYLTHSDDPGLPSAHVTVFWSLALAALAGRRFAVWGFPLLAIGLAVGWGRVYLGVHFPFDIVAALPVALAGAVLAGTLQRVSTPFVTRLLHCLDRLVSLLRKKCHAVRKT